MMEASEKYFIQIWSCKRVTSEPTLQAGALWTRTTDGRWLYSEREKKKSASGALQPSDSGRHLADTEISELEDCCRQINELREFKLLLAIPNTILRLSYYLNEKRFKSGLQITFQSRVWVIDPSIVTAKYLTSGPDNTLLSDCCIGSVFYIGSTSRYRGNMFGVILDKNYSGRGSSNGTFQGVEYFTCGEDDAVFCAAHRLLPFKSGSSDVTSPVDSSVSRTDPRSQVAIQAFVSPDSKLTNPEQPWSLSGGGADLSSDRAIPVTAAGTQATASSSTAAARNQCSAARDETPMLKIDDRVALMLDTGPEYGTVRWIGTLANLGNDLKAGVEFDNPIGRGTGKYRSVQLFKTKPKHAAIVPLEGLVKVIDLNDGEAGASANSGTVVGGASARGGASANSKTAVGGVEVRGGASANKGTVVGGAEARGGAEANRGTVVGGAEVRGGASATNRISAADVSGAADSAAAVMNKEGIEYPAYPAGNTGCMELAALLYAMFRCNSNFLSMPSCVQIDLDSPIYSLRQKLINEIIEPLQHGQLVRASTVATFEGLFKFILSPYVKNGDNLATILERFLSRFLRAEHLVTMTCGDPIYVYKIPEIEVSQISRAYRDCPSVQYLLECASILSNDQFTAMPKHLLLLERPNDPWYILPSLYVDLNSMLQYYPKVCSECGLPADLQCADCLQMDNGRTITNIRYCNECFTSIHNCHYRGHSEQRCVIHRSNNMTPFAFSSTAGETISTHIGNHGDSQPLATPEKQDTIMELFAFICMIDLKCVTYVRHDSPDTEHSGGNWYRHKYVTLNGEPSVTHCHEVHQFLNSHHIVSNINQLETSVREMVTGLRLCFYRKIAVGSLDHALTYLRNSTASRDQLNVTKRLH